MLRLIQIISCRARKVLVPISISSMHALEQETYAPLGLQRAPTSKNSQKAAWTVTIGRQRSSATARDWTEPPLPLRHSAPNLELAGSGAQASLLRKVVLANAYRPHCRRVPAPWTRLTLPDPSITTARDPA